MTKNPLINAGCAALYIMSLVLGIFYAGEYFGEREETILIPMVMLSLLVLSVTVMGMLFFYQPFVLYFDGHKKEAAAFLFKTIAIFAGITLLVTVALLLV